MTLYFYLLLFTISFPLSASWDKRFKYAQNFKYLFPAILTTGTFFIIWDIIFTKNGVWGFSEVHASSLKFFYLPIEEWLFFIIIPFSCVFIYESVKYFHKAEKYNSIARYIFLGTGVILIIVGSLNYERDYTFWNFIFCGIFLLYSGYKERKYHGNFLISSFMYKFLFSYQWYTDRWNFDFDFTTDPVVWYNNDENLSIRMITIHSKISSTIFSFFL